MPRPGPRRPDLQGLSVRVKPKVRAAGEVDHARAEGSRTDSPNRLVLGSLAAFDRHIFSARTNKAGERLGGVRLSRRAVGAVEEAGGWSGGRRARRTHSLAGVADAKRCGIRRRPSLLRAAPRRPRLKRACPASPASLTMDLSPGWPVLMAHCGQSDRTLTATTHARQVRVRGFVS